MRARRPLLLWLAALVLGALLFIAQSRAAEGERPVPRDYARVTAPPAPRGQTLEAMLGKSEGCNSCHVATDAPTMHASQAVRLGCTDCHGGDASVRGDSTLAPGDPRYVAARDRAHVLPTFPRAWGWPSSANPERSYALLNRESPVFVRFVNPSDYRVARESCGACHIETIEAGERSLMATGAMFMGGAAYNNGILPFKNYLVGEAYTREGKAAKLESPGVPAGTVTPRQAARGALAVLYPLPTWQVTPPADIFRVFERGGRTINATFPEIGLPNPTGSVQRLDEPGRPDLKQSNRGPGTGLRVAIPVLNIHKTRLNDPFTWFMGTNDQPGDYRHSGCAACHVIYANDREPRHSPTYARYGRDGQTQTVDPTINRLMQGARRGHGALKGDGESHPSPPPEGRGFERERGHPLRHAFTRAIPTAQCMNCHMHQPNIFLNSFLGYTMWDYEADAPSMWPAQQRYPSAAQVRAVLARNPEGAAPRGKWGDLDFLRDVYDLNPTLKDTQFADYHGHGWNFRGVFKRDREGNLLDREGRIVSPDDPEKWRRKGEGKFVPPGVNPGKTVHLMDIHAEKGMQCADCHFAQDSHGNGLIYGEVANAVEIGCVDCHGTPDEYPTLRTSGPAAPPRGNNLELLRNPDGQRRFEWVEEAGGRRALIQRSIVDPALEWRIALVRNSVDPTAPEFNAKAARAKLMSRLGGETGRFEFGTGVAPGDRAHEVGKLACFTCHLSWTTSCGGCHLPIEANWKTAVNRYEGETTRNFATYNPQVARDEMFQLGVHQTTKGNQTVPVRSSSALVLSSTNINRERIYVQQPPVSAAGFSSQAFAPHFPHTVRTEETKTCSDCHLSARDDNNAVMAQVLLLGTNYVNFVGLHAWTGLERGFQATRVTEWEEPQAVIGSYLHRYAYPDWYRLHVERNRRELRNWDRGRTFDAKLSGEPMALEQLRNTHEGTKDRVGCLQLRGEYMFVAEGRGGFRVYDVASIANKGVSERIVTAPFSALGHDSHVATTNATCMALPTGQPIRPDRNRSMAAMGVTGADGTPLANPDGTPMSLLQMNQEQAMRPIYDYAVITDAEEGLVLVDVTTLADGEFRNNKLRRARFAGGQLAWNPDNVLAGARHITLAGQMAYIAASRGLVVVDLADPLRPRLATVRPLADMRASALQFRYLWVTDAEGLKLFDVTRLADPVAVPRATVPFADARRIYLARTYAYVAAKAQGLAIVDITRPLAPSIHRMVTFDGALNDAEDVIVGSTNASAFAYVADGRNGLKVIQLTSPSSQPNFYGFSPKPEPELIAWAKTPTPAIALSKGLDRDRAVDETGGQIAVFGRLGSRPFRRQEMERLFLTRSGAPWKVSDEPDMRAWVGAGAGPLRRGE